MATRKSNGDPFTRHKTRHRGIVYRLRDGGERTYYVYAAGKYLAAGPGRLFASHSVDAFSGRVGWVLAL